MAYFINETYLKQNSVILNATEGKFLIQGIKNAEKKYVRSALGVALYQELKTQNDSGTLTSANQTLLDEYIKDAMVYYAKAEILPEIYSKIGNAGLQQMEDNNNKPASMDLLTFHIETAMNNGQYYVQQLIDFLKANAASYPLYGSSTNIQQPDSTQFDSGIYLGKEHRGYGSNSCNDLDLFL